MLLQVALKGSRIKFTATAANLYMVEGLLIGDGSIATPFDTNNNKLVAPSGATN